MMIDQLPVMMLWFALLSLSDTYTLTQLLLATHVSTYEN
jgi:hypothetical protein